MNNIIEIEVNKQEKILILFFLLFFSIVLVGFFIAMLLNIIDLSMKNKIYEIILGFLFSFSGLWYFLIFISLCKENYKKIIFNNEEKNIKILTTKNELINLSYEEIHHIELKRGLVLRGTAFSCFIIYLNNGAAH